MDDGNPQNPKGAYDYNGNIKRMVQYGYLQGSNQSIKTDDLTYNYKNNEVSNKLAKVTDGVGDIRSQQLGDFNDGVNAGDDYTYDVNGNLTSDLNKNITGITYNVLNLPQQITIQGKGNIVYEYDASGAKLNKTVNETGQPQKITTYLGGMIFENDVLQHVGMEEGRFRPNGSAFTADYLLKDHLGNVRSMINENGTLLEETHYYPFGLTMKGISYQNPTPSLQNKDKTFQGQKFDDDLGLNYYSFKYRNHDPQIGRFIEVDPLSDKYVHNSTYAFSENRVTDGIELEGLEWLSMKDLWRSAGISSSSDPKEFTKNVGKELLKPKTWVEGYAGAAQIAVPIILTEVATGGLGSGAIVDAEVTSLRTAANATKISEATEVKSLVSPKGELSSAPNFIVDAKGTAYPVPKDAKGPVLADNGKGIKFVEGTGGSNGQVSTMRVMDPTPQKGKSPGYPNGYIKYENASGQGVNPYTGKTGSKADTHFPINNIAIPKVDNTYVKKPLILP